MFIIFYQLKEERKKLKKYLKHSISLALGINDKRRRNASSIAPLELDIFFSTHLCIGENPAHQGQGGVWCDVILEG